MLKTDNNKNTKKTTTKKKGKKKKAVESRNILKSISSFFSDERTHFVLSLLTFFLAIYISIAFVSYLFTWKTDQSKLDINSVEYIKEANIIVENWGGKFGASISNTLMHDWFGIAAFGIVFIMILLSFKLLKAEPLPLKKSLKYTIIGMVWVSIAFAFMFGDSYFYLGGMHGFYISAWFEALIGSTGTAFLLIVAFMTFIVFSFEKSFPILKNFGRKIGDQKLSGIPKGFRRVIDANDNFVSVDNQLKIKKEESKKETDKQNEKPKEEKKDLSFKIKDKSKKIEETENKPKVNLDFEIENTKTTNEKLENTDNIQVEENPPKEEELEIYEDENTDDTYNLDEYDQTLDLSDYEYPNLELLKNHQVGNSEVSEEELVNNKEKIIETLKNFKIEIKNIRAMIGPTITLYEIVPAPGVRISKIKNLEDDIALSLSALGIRIIAPMPGRGTIGIEVPNQKPEIVSMRSVIKSDRFQKSKHELPLALGKTISNETYVADLTKMPHLLVAGATGQGKSVGLNVILTSLLYKKHPSEIKFVLVDPKKVELTLYEHIEKHFLAKLPDSDEPIITNNQKVIHTLASLNLEMDSRYELLKDAQVRNIKEYNVKFKARRLNPEKGHRFLPYIVLVIDEFADLIMTAGKEVELPIARLAQLARAIGIHLIVATQRPSTNIITGVIKANFPTRIAFKVASMMDSRTILDSPGANQLIGRGDMLITQGSDVVRLQCAFIDTPELEEITTFIGTQRGYTSAHLLPEFTSEDENETKSGVDLSKRDDLFEDAARIVVMHQQGSTSLIQRKLAIGYNRAGRIIDQLEAAGIVGPFEGSKARQVLYPDEYSLEHYLDNLRMQ